MPGRQFLVVVFLFHQFRQLNSALHLLCTFIIILIVSCTLLELLWKCSILIVILYICAIFSYSAFLSFECSKDRIRIIGAHLGAHSQPSANKAPEITGNSNRTRPPITTHVLDVARGSPASGIEVHLEVWKNASIPPSFNNKGFNGWATVGSSVTNNDGRSGQLMDIVENVAPGFYRISFNTAKYAPSGFFPYVSIIFEIKESQTAEHFHVPLLYSPFSFTTYRGS